VDQTRVLLVDDQENVRGAIRDVIAAIPGFVLAGEAASGEEAVAAVERLSPALVLMDVRLPGIGGMQATREIVNRYPEVVVMLMSIDEAEALPDSVHACGAAAFLRKQDLRPWTLRDVWEMQQEAQEGGAPARDLGGASRRDEPLS
jgi:two-component system, NarL family, invasion response regulator UvrY